MRKSSLNSPLFASNLHKFWSRSRFPSRRTPKSDRLLAVITEVVYVLDFSHRAQQDFLCWAEHALTIDTETVADMPRIRALLNKYRDLPADFADASLVALCERLRITRVASVDADFSIYRVRGRHHFRNLFFE
uniref:PIN domain-containing protein n=1 Tax=Candidatus Kentrum sp. DK TaxID=2126562 RepID=A0A450S8Y3_9GAMM|nr:MAG: hypothetical protein BECKDK2373B_GA0170837_102059 [Candidatus Kentron sp. DK]